jgi:hypothetical protein
MKMLLVGAVGMVVLQVLLVGGYFALGSQGPILLHPDSKLDEYGITMVMLCGEEGRTPDGRHSEILEKMPPTETGVRGGGEGPCGAIAVRGARLPRTPRRGSEQKGGATTARVPLPGVAAHPPPQPSRSPRSRGRPVEAYFPFSAIVTRC